MHLQELQLLIERYRLRPRSIGRGRFKKDVPLKFLLLLFGAGGLLAAPATAQMAMPGMTMPMPAKKAPKKLAARKAKATKKAPANKAAVATKKAPAQHSHQVSS